MRLILCALVGSLLFGCTAFSQQAQLAQMNEWHDVGLLDGKTGHYQRAKVELQALNTLDKLAYEEYMQGYVIGIEEFCKPDNAFDQGERGVRYQGQCANTSQENAAVQKWKQGYLSYGFESFPLGEYD